MYTRCSALLWEFDIEKNEEEARLTEYTHRPLVEEMKETMA